MPCYAFIIQQLHPMTSSRLEMSSWLYEGPEYRQWPGGKAEATNAMLITRGCATDEPLSGEETQALIRSGQDGGRKKKKICFGGVRVEDVWGTLYGALPRDWSCWWLCAALQWLRPLGSLKLQHVANSQIRWRRRVRVCVYDGFKY